MYFALVTMLYLSSNLAAATTPTHAGLRQWDFEVSERFEDFQPYKERDSKLLNPGRADANYPPQLRDLVEPFVRRAGLDELRRLLSESGVDPTQGALFDYSCVVRFSRAPRGKHDGDGGIITFTLRCRAVVLGPDRRFAEGELRRTSAREADEGWIDVPLGNVAIISGESFGRLRVSNLSGPRRWIRFISSGQTNEVDLQDPANARACELALAT